MTNASGYLCHISVVLELDLPPAALFRVFTHEDNAGAFRDIVRLGYRRVVASAPNHQTVRVEQVGRLRIAWLTREFSNHIIVEEDARDAERLVTTFTLVRSVRRRCFFFCGLAAGRAACSSARSPLVSLVSNQNTSSPTPQTPKHRTCSRALPAAGCSRRGATRPAP